MVHIGNLHILVSILVDVVKQEHLVLSNGIVIKMHYILLLQMHKKSTNVPMQCI